MPYSFVRLVLLVSLCSLVITLALPPAFSHLLLPVQAQTTTSGTIPSQIENPLGQNVRSVPDLVNNLVKGILGVVGALALGMFVYGGFIWLTSMGNSQRIQKGQQTLIWATLGLLVIFSSYAIIDRVFEALTGN